jgi:hypothetical protein
MSVVSSAEAADPGPGAHAHAPMACSILLKLILDQYLADEAAAMPLTLSLLQQVGFLGDAEISLGDAESSLGDAESSLGDAESSLGDAESSLGDAESSLGDAESSLGDAESSLGDAESSLGDAESSLIDAESSLGDAESSLGDAESSLGDAESSLGDAESSLGDVSPVVGVAARERARALLRPAAQPRRARPPHHGAAVLRAAVALASVGATPVLSPSLPLSLAHGHLITAPPSFAPPSPSQVSVRRLTHATRSVRTH